MPTFQEVIDSTKSLTPNIVIDIEGTFFAMRLPDSGVPDALIYEGLVVDAQFPRIDVDINRQNTAFPSIKIELLDKDYLVSQFLSEFDTIFAIEKSVIVYYGFSDAGMDLADYIQTQPMRIINTQYKKNIWILECRTSIDFLKKGAYQQAGTLLADIDEVASSFSISIDSDLPVSTEWPLSSHLKIDDEIVEYGSYTILPTAIFFTLVPGSRGSFGTIPAEHKLGALVQHVYVVEGNPIDILIDLLSDSGTLPEAAGIPISEIDVTQFESVRDAYYPLVLNRFFLTGIENLLEWLEEFILIPYQIRLTVSPESNKIQLIPLVPSTAIEPTETIEDYETKGASYKIESDAIVNKLLVLWDFVPGIGYRRKSSYNLTSSQNLYGIRELTYQVPGASTDLSGKIVIDTIAIRSFQRSQEPGLQVSLKTQIDKSLIPVTSVVDVQIPFFPTPEDPAFLSRAMNILSKNLNFLNGTVQYKLAATRFSKRSRVGRYCPRSLISSVVALDKLEVSTDANFWKEGDFVTLYDESTGIYSELGEIADIDFIDFDSATFTFVAPFVSPMVGMFLALPNYDDATAEQKDRWAWWADEGAQFPDGGDPYTYDFG